MATLYEPAQKTLENALLEELSPTVPWTLIERFTTLVRESASEDEREAARYIAAQLETLGVPHKVYNPDLFLSVPVKSSMQVNGKTIRAKSPAFSISTAPEGITGEVIYVPNAGAAKGVDIFGTSPKLTADVRGKVVLFDGFGGPPPVMLFEQLGAIAQIYINPGVDIHWGICTSIWGAPDLDNYQRQPRSAVISISRPDGQALIDQLTTGTVTATVHTQLKEGWFPCPVIVADIKGVLEPDRFVLVHGHYDSWDVGIGDNAVGDGTLLELARVFNKHSDHLGRSIRIAWWPGHSTGRYAGSTWFADQFGLDLARNCIAQVDIDSPGCRWATEYYDISWMTETADFCKQAIKDVTGKDAHGERPHQAGDYSFNNIGLSGFFMLLSAMPKDKIEAMNYYPVGGCGSNIAWHTENDTLEIADKDNLMRDLRVYVATLQRVVNNALYPFDFRKLADEFQQTLDKYQAGTNGEVDFSPAYAALKQLNAALQALYAKSDSLTSRPITDPAVQAYNNAVLELGRILIPINYTREGLFRTEPAVKIPPLPDLAPALEYGATAGHIRHVTRTHLVRGVNRVAWAFESGAKAAQLALGIIGA